MENTKRIDIRWLRKNRRLSFNHTGTLSWTQSGRADGSINYEMYSDRMVLSFKSRSVAKPEWQEVTQIIRFDETPCHYGGSRKWFLCPNCRRRVAVLAGLGTYFYCRKCYRLPYHSTLESDRDRVLTKKHELGEAIFENYEYGDGWMKKKGMHQKTFDRKLKEYRHLEKQIHIETQRFIDLLNTQI